MAVTYFNPIKLENLKNFKKKKLKSQKKMAKGLKKKLNRDHNIDWVDASSRMTYIFDLIEIVIEDKS